MLDKSFERGLDGLAFADFIHSWVRSRIRSGFELRGQPLDVNTVLAFELFSCPNKGEALTDSLRGR